MLLTPAAGDKARRACLGWLPSPNLRMGFPGDLLHRDVEPLIASWIAQATSASCFGRGGEGHPESRVREPPRAESSSVYLSLWLPGGTGQSPQ